MTAIHFAVTGDREVALKFEEFPRQVHDRLLERIRDLTAELETNVRAAEPERTGRLRSETSSRIFDQPTRIHGQVSIAAEFGKAGALEYGSHRKIEVRAHQARLDHVFSRLADLEVEVGAHARLTDVAEHRFLRGPLESMTPEILASLEEALSAAAQA